MTTDATRYDAADLGPEGGPPGGADRRWWYAAGAVAAAAAITVAAVLVAGDDSDTVVAPPAASSAPSAAASSAPSSAPSAGPSAGASTAPTARPPGPGPVDRSTAVWPWAGSTVRYTDPVGAARGFAVDFLGFRSPVVGAFAQGDARSGEVEVRPRANGPATTVLVRQLSGEQSWSVLGATTANIVVSEPQTMAVLRSPVSVRGTALAFEGNVEVEVRQDGRTAPLGKGVVTGGGDQMRPFAGTVTFSRPTADLGALVLLTRSAENGQVWEAAVQRVRLSGGGTAAPAACRVPDGPQPGPGQMTVRAFFSCDPKGQAEVAPTPVRRVVPRSPAVLRSSLTALLAGPTAEESDAGLRSWFSSKTAGMLRGVTLEQGRAVVDLGDLRPVLQGASSSAGSAVLLGQLDATVFQFPTVSSVEYRLEGDCAAFSEWLQLDSCRRSRP